VANTRAYYNTATITTEKSFITPKRGASLQVLTRVGSYLTKTEMNRVYKLMRKRQKS
jgi:hypothetical protein